MTNLENISNVGLSTLQMAFLTGLAMGGLLMIGLGLFIFQLFINLKLKQKLNSAQKTPSANFTPYSRREELAKRTRFTQMKRSYTDGQKLPDFTEDRPRPKMAKKEYSDNVISLDAFRNKKSIVK